MSLRRHGSRHSNIQILRYSKCHAYISSSVIYRLTMSHCDSSTQSSNRQISGCYDLRDASRISLPTPGSGTNVGSECTQSTSRNTNSYDTIDRKIRAQSVGGLRDVNSDGRGSDERYNLRSSIGGGMFLSYLEPAKPVSLFELQESSNCSTDLQEQWVAYRDRDASISPAVPPPLEVAPVRFN